MNIDGDDNEDRPTTPGKISVAPAPEAENDITDDDDDIDDEDEDDDIPYIPGMIAVPPAPHYSVEVNGDDDDDDIADRPNIPGMIAVPPAPHYAVEENGDDDDIADRPNIPGMIAVPPAPYAVEVNGDDDDIADRPNIPGMIAVPPAPHYAVEENGDDDDIADRPYIPGMIAVPPAPHYSVKVNGDDDDIADRPNIPGMIAVPPAPHYAVEENGNDDDIADRPNIPGMIAVAPAPEAENDITEEVALIVNKLRELYSDFIVDPNEVYALLEPVSANANRTNIVIDRLITKWLKEPEEAPLNIPGEQKADKYDELLNDVEVVSKVVRNKSREEILAYLEAFHANPDRVRIVIGELLGMNGPAPFPAANDVRSAGNDGAATSAESMAMEKVKSILELFPDADPDYLRNFVEKSADNVNNINATVYGWMENRNYPKLAEVRQAATKRKIVESDFSVEEFLEMFPDPENYFNNEERTTTASYRFHVDRYLQNQFKYAFRADLLKVMHKHRFHLTPVMKELNAIWNVSPTEEPLAKKTKKTVRTKKFPTQRVLMPKTIDELFYKEKLFIEMEDKIKQYKKDKEEQRLSKIAVAKAADELMECSCCFEDEVLLEDMLQCTDGHLFCRTCVRRQAEMHIGLGKYEFPCIDPYCESAFPPIVLQDVLPANVFSNVVRKMQEEEIRRADIPDLESCPHCSFCAIILDASLKIFRCLNPECLKVTCRLCKQPNHLPLGCDEQKSEVQFRTYVEDHMTDALVRTCPKCKRRIIKEHGCNKMTCTCGQQFCYLCRETIRDYKHFDDRRCPLFSNDDELHRLEVQEGAKKAKQDYMETHPEARGSELRHDPAQAPFAAVQRQQQLYARAAMPRVNEQGQIVFQDPRPMAANNYANQQQPAQAQLPFNLPWPFNFWRPAPRPPPVAPAPRLPLAVPAPDPFRFRPPAPDPFLFGPPAPNPFLFGPPPPAPDPFLFGQPAPNLDPFGLPAPRPRRRRRRRY